MGYLAQVLEQIYLSLFVSAIATGQDLVYAENWVEPDFKTERSPAHQEPGV